MTIGGGAKNPKLVCGRGKECGYSRPYEEGSLEASGDVGVEVADTGGDDTPPRAGRDVPAAVSP
jgi:hypothetical protein